MTDHGNMFGAVEFYKRRRERGVQPIIGCEMYVAPQQPHRAGRRGATTTRPAATST